MKRAILRLPEGENLDTLLPEQIAALQSVNAQFVLPMPGTVPADGFHLVDGVAGDNFDPAVMPSLGMPWEVVGLWQWDGQAREVLALTPLNGETLLRHLPPTYEYDEDGNVTRELPPALHLPHAIAGWPQVPIPIK